MPTALTFNIDTANNRLLNPDGVTALRQLRLVNGETYTVSLSFVGTVPEIDELAFYVRTQVGTNNLVSVSTFSGNSTAGYTFSLPLTAVTLLTALGNEDSVILKGYFSWTEGVEIELIEGIKIVLSAASDDAGTTASYVSSINAITGAALITGAGNVTVSNAGQTVTISGANQDLSPYALTSSLNATGNALNASIFALQGQTGTYYPLTNPSGYQTAANVSTSLSAYLTSATAASTYATIANLAATGSALNASITVLQGQTGDYYPRTNPSGYQTAANVSSSLSSYYPLNNPSGYLNLNSGVVMTTGNQTISGNKNFAGLLTGTLGSMSFVSGRMYDSADKPSIDWASRTLYNSSNQTTLNWTSRTAYNSAGSAVINWGYETLNDGAGALSVDWGNRRLVDTSNSTILDWQALYLYDDDGFTSIDWGNRFLRDDAGASSVNWNDRRLIDSIGSDSINWELKTLAGGSWDFAAGATSSTLGTDWSIIGDTEVVTKGAVAARSKSYIQTSSFIAYANNNTNLQNTALQIPNLGVGTYDIYVVLYFGANSQTPSHKFKLNFGGTATSSVAWVLAKNNGGDDADALPGTISTTYSPSFHAGSNSSAFASIRVIISVSVAGSLTVQYAQQTAHASDSGLRVGSAIISQQIANT